MMNNTVFASVTLNIRIKDWQTAKEILKKRITSTINNPQRFIKVRYVQLPCIKRVRKKEAQVTRARAAKSCGACGYVPIFVLYHTFIINTSVLLSIYFSSNLHIYTDINKSSDN